MKKVIVIGGGAAGMMAAYTAAEKGDKVILIEKNEKLGKKLYITGKGRCNLTNDCQPQDFLSNVCSNSRFLTSAIYSFSPSDLQKMIEERGLPLKTERGDRVFPLSDKSNDVIRCFTDMLKNVGVEIRLNEAVIGIETANGLISAVNTTLGKYSCDKLIIATGGMSYSSTGSSGDGYTFSKKLGHKIIPLCPALSAMKIQESFCGRLTGLALKNVSLSFQKNGKIISEFGEMLFTHSGISGPITLTLSSRINRQLCRGDKLYIDLKPALSIEQLDARLLRDFDERKNRTMKNSLGGVLPLNMISVVLKCANIDSEKSNNILTKEERLRLVGILKGLPMTFEAFAPLDEAIVTAGGVSVNEINPKTMASKLVPNLFFAGEVIDVDAYTGGFNLQIAFSTGRKAGLS